MKNLSINKKLITGFGVVLFMLLVSGIFSIINENRISSQINLYAKYTVPNYEHLRVIEVSSRAVLHDLGEAIMEDNTADVQKALDSADKFNSSILSELDAFQKNQSNSDRDAQIESIRTTLTEIEPVKEEISTLALEISEESNAKAYDLYLNQYKPSLTKAITVMEELADMAKEQAMARRDTSETIVLQSRIITAFIIIVSFLITMFIIVITRRSILKPVNEIVNVFEEMSKGNMNTSITYESHDEIGQMAKLIQKTNIMQGKILSDLTDKFELISKGDLQFTVDGDYPGDFAALKVSVENTVTDLNNTLQIISNSAEQVNAGASQVSGGAQALAAGSTEQASSIDELTVSIEKIADQASENSDSVRLANMFVQQAGTGVSTGNEQMKHLTEAMEEIKSSSNQIANITKVIEDIAFQTNILALNAAIEAARAGEAGKGFAVVADEVRSLAAKSAEAAKQTSDLIKNSVDTVLRGTKITAQTAQILEEVGESTSKVTESFSKIGQASAEQANSIEQIQQGLNQVSAVVQTNAATAEENSATSEQMSAQSNILREEIGRFKLSSNVKEESDMENYKAEIDFNVPSDITEEISDFGKY
jgi:methyl-accepting chemotaxis protein